MKSQIVTLIISLIFLQSCSTDKGIEGTYTEVLTYAAVNAAAFMGNRTPDVVPCGTIILKKDGTLEFCIDKLEEVNGKIIRNGRFKCVNGSYTPLNENTYQLSLEGDLAPYGELLSNEFTLGFEKKRKTINVEMNLTAAEKMGIKGGKIPFLKE